MYVQTGKRNAETVEACFHLLREAGADLNARDSAGFTALHHVASCSSSYEAHMIPGLKQDCLQLASLLLRHGADVNATDAQSIAGHTSPLHEAVFCSAMTDLLVKAGAEVNFSGRNGRTPLYKAVMIAARWGHVPIRPLNYLSLRGTVPILLRAGAAIIGDVSDHVVGDPADYDFSQGVSLYFQKVIDAGGFKKYEQAHLARLTATFAPKLRLPARPARLVAEYWGHVGFY